MGLNKNKISKTDVFNTTFYVIIELKPFIISGKNL